ncbi:unnamed protein product [Lampetra planeri]
MAGGLACTRRRGAVEDAEVPTTVPTTRHLPIDRLCRYPFQLPLPGDQIDAGDLRIVNSVVRNHFRTASQARALSILALARALRFPSIGGGKAPVGHANFFPSSATHHRGAAATLAAHFPKGLPVQGKP